VPSAVFDVPSSYIYVLFCTYLCLYIFKLIVHNLCKVFKYSRAVNDNLANYICVLFTVNLTMTVQD